jgi:hypothetical protein
VAVGKGEHGQPLRRQERPLKALAAGEGLGHHPARLHVLGALASSSA